MLHDAATKDVDAEQAVVSNVVVKSDVTKQKYCCKKAMRQLFYDWNGKYIFVIFMYC
jgi:hypothetical protein